MRISKSTVYLYQLSHPEQDKLYNYNVCPYCQSQISDKEMTEDYIIWDCKVCNTQYIVE